MLTKFTVRGYRQFSDELIFDFSAKKYDFNKACVKGGFVNTALVYGKNGTGKSCLGLAVFDAVEHLTDHSSTGLRQGAYINALSETGVAEFSYHFVFEKIEVIYRYSKNSSHEILKEHLVVDGLTIIDYQKGSPVKIDLEGAETLNTQIYNNLSALKYIYNNTNLDKSKTNNKIFYKLVEFINNMLWFRGELEGFDYIGFENSSGKISKSIIDNGNLKDFESFLNDCEIGCKLTVTESNGEEEIAFLMGNKRLPLFKVASTGTNSLALFYHWWQKIRENKASLVFIDEFDAFYHFSVSKTLVRKLIELSETQIILTTHNTFLLSNDLIRPDCGFIIDGKQIQSLHNSTDKELRFAHNLEKFYRAGGFGG